MKPIPIISVVIIVALFMKYCKKDEDNAIKDYDGNIYTSVAIGTQVWMIENLKTSHFNNGTAIPLITDGTAWSNLGTPGYCWYNNDGAANKDTYGALYNWFTVSTGNLCPKGWHVPSQEEWAALATYLGGDHAAGNKLKEAGSTHWQSPNTGADNSSGFTALPGGYRYDNDVFEWITINGFWWSSTYAYGERSYSRELDIEYSDFFVFNDPKKAGFSVRCLKDN